MQGKKGKRAPKGKGKGPGKKEDTMDKRLVELFGQMEEDHANKTEGLAGRKRSRDKELLSIDGSQPTTYKEIRKDEEPVRNDQAKSSFLLEQTYKGITQAQDSPSQQSDTPKSTLEKLVQEGQKLQDGDKYEKYGKPPEMQTTEHSSGSQKKRQRTIMEYMTEQQQERWWEPQVLDHDDQKEMAALEKASDVDYPQLTMERKGSHQPGEPDHQKSNPQSSSLPRSEIQ